MQLDELPGPVSSMVPVQDHSLGEWKPENDHDRSDGSTDHPEVGMTFPDVVHQRRCYDLSIVMPIRDDTQSGVIAVTLIRIHLLEEHLSQLRGKPRGNGGPLGDREWLRGEDIEEPSGQVAQRAGHRSGIRLGLAIDAEHGRRSELHPVGSDLFATVIAGAVGPSGNMGQSPVDIVQLVLQ